ncbi:CRTAM protein, partial [Neodrepanis coruscans]|nr:CRTAM protein [Neodrepanis coruscans]
ALQWSNPRGFTIFLNTQQVLRGQRYKLLHHSKDELSIQVSNVTVHDEGSYQCLCYSRVIRSKAQAVEVLAAPSNPVLEGSQDTKRGITLSCSTQGCKPQPQISWLLDNGIELPGDTKHKLGADGKKWSTTSTLRVLSYRPNATATCIIQHPALGEGRLVASSHLEELSRTGTAHQKAPPALPIPFHCSEMSPAGSSLSAAPEGPAGSSSAPPPTQQNLTADLTSPYPKSKGVLKKEKNLLLPILVAALLFVLLIIVLLFMMKLKKAHGVWKRENDVSEQTLESYKSRSNEDSPGHEKNGN